MAFTKCPNCRKVQQVVPKLVSRDIGCMDGHCGKTFKAFEYRLHSGKASKAVFWFTIAFAVFMLFRWVWYNSPWIMYSLS